MSIYTRTGDTGNTSLFDGNRIKKSDDRVHVYGTFDECGAHVSLSEKMIISEDLKPLLIWIQKKLFILNAEIATKKITKELTEKSDIITSKDVKQLEDWIDYYNSNLIPVKSFILQGKTLSAAQLHVARTVCRRGERLLIKISESENIRPELLEFVNRLSDCLYIFARVEDNLHLENSVVELVINRYKQTIDSSKENDLLKKTTKIFEACINQANIENIPVAMAIVNSDGKLLSFYQMPNTILVGADLAIKKAISAVSMKTDTEELSKVVQPNSPLYQLECLTDGKIVSFGGGLVIKDFKKQIIAGLGVSGGTVDQDVRIALKGRERFEELLNE